jgi:glycerophosphoryl diester phosphodiesterase
MKPSWRSPARDIPLVVAHRGASADEPENTLAAFRRARRDGADGVELDVLRCATGEVVVFHDDELSRLCGVPGDVRAQSLVALRALSVRGEPIPELWQVLEELGPEMLVNVELKSAPGLRGTALDDGLAYGVAEALRRHNMGDRALVSSFDPVLLGRMRAVAPEVQRGLLFAADQSLPLRRGWAAMWVGAAAVHPEVALVDEPRMAAWRKRQLAVNVWTVDDPGELRYLASLGVDGVITNRPKAAREALRA